MFGAQIGETYADRLRAKSLMRQSRKANSVIPNIPHNAHWSPNGTTVAGGTKMKDKTNELASPLGLAVDDDQTIIVADFWNHRIVQYKNGDTEGQVVAGGHGNGKELNQLCKPSHILIDKETDSLIICDRYNYRVVRWPRCSGTTQGEILIDGITCSGLAMDDQNYLYVSHTEINEVRRYRIGEKNGTLVAGGNGRGNDLNQLNVPTYIVVDKQQNIYVSDWGNHRVMKWNKDAKEGMVVAGVQGKGNDLTQLNEPTGIFLDTSNTLYVADSANHRVLRYFNGEKSGTVIAGGNGKGSAANQLKIPEGISFDLHGNLYVVDKDNTRVQRFSIV